MSRSYTSSPPCTSIGVLWDCFSFLNKLYTKTCNIAHCMRSLTLKFRFNTFRHCFIKAVSEEKFPYLLIFFPQFTSMDVKRGYRIMCEICVTQSLRNQSWISAGIIQNIIVFSVTSLCKNICYLRYLTTLYFSFSLRLNTEINITN
jgi:hypothetical protein